MHTHTHTLKHVFSFLFSKCTHTNTQTPRRSPCFYYNQRAAEHSTDTLNRPLDFHPLTLWSSGKFKKWKAKHLSSEETMHTIVSSMGIECWTTIMFKLTVFRSMNKKIKKWWLFFCTTILKKSMILWSASLHFVYIL